MNYSDDDDFSDPDAQDIEEQSCESLKFRNFVKVCPACKQSITDEMDSCPYCGDILFRHLSDGMFAPRKGPLVKIFAGVVVVLVVLAVLGLLLSLLP